MCPILTVVDLCPYCRRSNPVHHQALSQVPITSSKALLHCIPFNYLHLAWLERLWQLLLNIWLLTGGSAGVEELCICNLYVMSVHCRPLWCINSGVHWGKSKALQDEKCGCAGRVKRCSSKQVELTAVGVLCLRPGWHNNGYIFPRRFPYPHSVSLLSAPHTMSSIYSAKATCPASYPII